MVGGQAPFNGDLRYDAIQGKLVPIGHPDVPGGISSTPAPIPSKQFIQFELPPSIAHYSHDIRRFVEAMLYKLEKNAHKGKWEGYTVEEAFKLMQAEVEELKREVGGNSIKMVLEAADVANFALMIANIATERGK